MSELLNRLTFNLEIAGISISIESQLPDIKQNLAVHYWGYHAVNSMEDIRLIINRIDDFPFESNNRSELVRAGREYHFYSDTCRGRIDLKRCRAELSITGIRQQESIDYFIRVLIALLVFESGGLLVHGAGIVVENFTFIFFGHSGSGKTTVSNLSRNGTVLSDDLIIIKPDQTIWRAYATPFGRLVTRHSSGSGHSITAMYRLVKDSKNYLENMPVSLALAELLGSAPVVSNLPEFTERVINRCEKIIQGVPIYRLHFLPDESFWGLIS